MNRIIVAKICTIFLFIILNVAPLSRASLRKDQIVLLTKNAAYEAAFNLCKIKSMSLINIQDFETDKIVYEVVKDLGIKSFWVATDYSKTKNELIGKDEIKVIEKNGMSDQSNYHTNNICAYILVENTEKLEFTTCTTEHPVICLAKLSKVSLRKNQLLILPKLATHKLASNLCKEYNMSLVKIQDFHSNKIVLEFAKEKEIKMYWIDANDKKTENEWLYNDGTKIIYNNWIPGQPDNDGDNEDCAHSSVEKNGKWNDLRCTNKLSVICYSDIQRVSLRKNQLLVLPKLATHKLASNLCKEYNMSLVKIQDFLSNKIVLEFAKEKEIKMYWIDANDKKTENEWLYNDGTKIIYNNWIPGQPDNDGDNEDCAHSSVEKNGKWNDLRCTNKLSVICYSDIQRVSLRKNQLLVLPKLATHKLASNLCKEYNMSLVKIQDFHSNKIVLEFAKEKEIKMYWIDANDKKTENEWLYNDGTKIIYNNWIPGQPDNDGDNEDCVHSSVEKNGKWNDLPCTDKLSVICYIDVQPESPEKNKLFLLPSSATYEGALNICKEMKMNLIKIENAEFNQIVYEFAEERKVRSYWIDANDRKTENEWVYGDGNKIVYSNWNECQPDNYINEDCVHATLSGKGKWNDIFCCTKLSVICYCDKICSV